MQSTCAATQANSAPAAKVRSSGLIVVWRERILCDPNCGLTMLRRGRFVKFYL